MSFTSTQLASELTADPVALGYASRIAAGDDQAVATLLNAPRTGVTVFTDVSSDSFLDAMDATEFGALTQVQLLRLQMFLSRETISLSKANIRAVLAAVFPVAGPTRTAVTTISQRLGSRAEQLYGVGTVITPVDVARALGRV